MKTAKRFVFLDPDGTLEIGLCFIVEANTGILYGTECNGVAAEQRQVEGYLIPLGVGEQEKELSAFFERISGRDLSQGEWSGQQITELTCIISSIECWECAPDGEDTPYTLALNTERMGECVEAWVPVKTPNQIGYLVWKNSD